MGLNLTIHILNPPIVSTLTNQPRKLIKGKKEVVRQLYAVATKLNNEIKILIT